ncbi:hypothetical protein DCAR_0418320 [Daucus carota subsp. sativus]|uniref:Uncharacterized protein n=1 Tax=Daucus carota subsp. sativus TaxID=79200 RepID=A0A165ZBH5_DAUCS|nr:hypothetical protein DCAR_0418320 [Daucus carota subsp. sativus]
MASRRSSSSLSFWLVFGIVIVLAISQLGAIECRALRSTIAEGCDQPGEGANSMGMTQFGVASADHNNSSSDESSVESSIRSLLFKLASGPSKRGPGH